MTNDAQLTKHVKRPTHCNHDAPGPFKRWRKNIWVGSKWYCNKCDRELLLTWNNLGEHDWVVYG